MKGIIILSIMLFSILCQPFESCFEEKDLSQCKKHTFESKYSFLSCFKYEDDEGIISCVPFFNTEKNQKSFRKFMKGMIKEELSVFPLSEVDLDENYQDFEKDSYGIDDVVTYKNIPFSDLLTEEDKKIINNNNTCLYQSKARFVDPDNYKGAIKINISDANLCYNADRFEDLKDLFDCGHATIKAQYNNTQFVFNNCYMIPDQNMDKDFRKGIDEIYIKPGYKLYVQEILPEFIKKASQYPQLFDKSKGRQLQEEMIECEMIIKDRYGNIIHYNKNGEEVDGDDPTKILNSSRYYVLNIILLFCYILLFA